jgi:hypothetical protein
MDLDVQSYNIGHLGIVAGIFDVLKIGEVIDNVLPKARFKESTVFDNNKSYDPQWLGFHSSTIISISQLFHDDSYRKAAW